MPTKIDGLTGVDQIQDGAVNTSAKLGNSVVTPAKTQVGALPGMVRLNTSNGYGSTNNKIRRFTNIVTNQGADITYADSATLGASFTINTAGVYAISYSDQFSVSGAWNGLTLNTATPTTAIFSCAVGEVISAESSGANNGAQSSWTGYLPSGSVIRPHTDGTSAGAIVAVQQFSITRVA